MIMDIESELKKLKLRSPSPELDRRVLGQREEPVAIISGKRKQVPLWAALAAAILLGVFGFLLGTTITKEKGSYQPSVVTTEVILSSTSALNPFDFTVPSEDFPAGELKAELFIPKGVKK